MFPFFVKLTLSVSLRIGHSSIMGYTSRAALSIIALLDAMIAMCALHSIANQTTSLRSVSTLWCLMCLQSAYVSNCVLWTKYRKMIKHGWHLSPWNILEWWKNHWKTPSLPTRHLRSAKLNYLKSLVARMWSIPLGVEMASVATCEASRL